ncbi:MAG: SPOR domain-containing protein, partial [Bacteroidia bacterium]|nr:SPOR domain-containing protein [Bacteroidia bacterium]
VRDSEDLCPNEFGSKRTNGCRDNDEDGLVGEDDLCPNAYGSKNEQGCPDSDGDGLHDGVDKCPNKAGEKRYAGCPEENENLSKENKPKKDNPKEEKPKSEKPKSEIKTASDSSKFANWDFEYYEYWPVVGAYNDIRWAQELQSRLKDKLNVSAEIKTIEGISKYYVTLGKAKSKAEAKNIQEIIDIPSINNELNGSLWWKKVVK